MINEQLIVKMQADLRMRGFSIHSKRNYLTKEKIIEIVF